ncbi:sensor histidine kinase [Curtobacterium sp. Leaf261]|uniref:sensor histidine kinase n=1 Tax=Curtobacterium sp. Leaf261 TaxID=1736311 RepID=UPI00071306EE|nr:histidine kinase [Curtobacterium sp. Leaf261]KQO64099.1 hypothetical protein ASF23_17395 [Curtobacterium sp. Leaf261]
MPDRRPAEVPADVPADSAPPRPPGRVRASMARHPRAVDAAVAAAYFIVAGFGLASEYLATGVGRPLAADVAVTIALVVATVALLARRRRPALTWGVVLATTIVTAFADGGLDPGGVSLALYALAVHRSSRGAWLGFGVTVLVGAAVVPAAALARSGAGAGDVRLVSPVFVLVTLVAVLIGVAVGGRRRWVAALIDRAERLERERDQRERLATAAERARITREMHDIVAHGISVMVSLADGADALAEKDPARSRAALGDIVDVGRRSLTDMRRLLGALDDESTTDLGPAPTVAGLPALVESYRSAGLPVTLEASGTAPRSEGVQTAVYRIVQEALTNALRYADRPEEARVAIAYGPPVSVVVTDDGRGVAEGGTPSGSCRGLVGMRERARLYGGSVEAGPQLGGGWRVAAVLPDVEEERL